MSLKQLFKGLATLARADVSMSTAANWVPVGESAGTAVGKLSVPGSSRPLENAIMAFSCIVCRRDAIGGCEPLVTDGDNNVLESSDLLELLKQPNADQDWDAFCRQMETHLTLHNCCAIHALKDPIRPELNLLHPEGLRANMGAFEPTGTPRVTSWDYIDPTTGQARTFKRDEIAIRTGYNPHAPLSTLSPLKVLERTLKGDIAAREQNLGLFLNDATPRGYLRTDSNSTPEQMKAILDVWNKANQGYMNRHKTAGVWGGVKHESIQLSPAELEFMESLKFMRMDYYMVFRVYPAMLSDMMGETGLSQGSSTDSQRVAWWEDVGLPELKLVASVMMEAARKVGVVKPGAKEVIWYNPAAIPALARQRLSKLDSHVKAVGVGYKPDEINKYLDLGLPDHADNKARVAFSLQTIGEGEEQKPELNAKGAKAAEEKIAKEETARSTQHPALAILNRIETLARADGESHGSPIPEKWRGLRQAFDGYVKPLEKQAATRWSRFFIEQRGRVLARISTHGASLHLPEASRAGDLPPLRRADQPDVLHLLLPRRDEDKALAVRIAPMLSEHLKAGGEFFSKEVGRDVSRPFEIAQDPAFEAAIERRQVQALRVNDTTEDDIRRIWRAAYDSGDTLSQFADRIAAYYKDQCVGEETVRPMTAAATMTTGLVNEGRMIAAREAGGLKKAWLHSASGPDDREEHVAAMSRYADGIPLDAEFEINGHRCDAPGDPRLPAGEVCNCHCMVVFVTLTEEDVAHALGTTEEN
jgi:HK97 family phage portal protein